jgi:hypothetical protein
MRKTPKKSNHSGPLTLVGPAQFAGFDEEGYLEGVGALAPQESNDIKGLLQTAITETCAISMTYISSAPTPLNDVFQATQRRRYFPGCGLAQRPHLSVQPSVFLDHRADFTFETLYACLRPFRHGGAAMRRCDLV